jgi:hypothetical protein
MEVRVWSLPSESLGSILLKLMKGVHFLASKIGDLHIIEALVFQLVDHQYDQADCKQKQYCWNDN